MSLSSADLSPKKESLENELLKPSIEKKNTHLTFNLMEAMSRCSVYCKRDQLVYNELTLMFVKTSSTTTCTL